MTAIITKHGTGVPPSDALQQGELAVDLDGLKLYTSTDGSDVVEVSEGALDVVWTGSGENAEDGSERGSYDFWLKNTGMGENPEIPYPQFQYIHGEETTKANFSEIKGEKGLIIGSPEKGEKIFEADIWEDQIMCYKPVQAPDYLDADGNSIIGAGGGAWVDNGDWISIDGEPNGGYSVNWSYSDGSENYLWCFEVDCKEVGGEIGYFTEFGSDKVEIGTAPSGFSASKEKFVAKRSEKGIAVPMAEGDTPLVVHGNIQANDLVDAEGNSLLGGADGEYVPAEFYPSYDYTSYEGATANEEDVWKTPKLSADWLHAPRFEADKAFFNEQITSTRGLTSHIARGVISGGVGGFTEVIALGGINIPASAEDLPFSVDEEDKGALEMKVKSIQKAFTVTHETLGRTVEIDKEGTIRANAFTDMDGNPIGGNFEMPDVIDGGTY